MWFTRITKTKRVKLEVQLEDLIPAPEFEASIEEALEHPTTAEKFQGVYRVLSRWGDVVPLEIEIGSSIALSGADLKPIQEIDERGFDNISQFSTIKNMMVTITGADVNLTYSQWAAIKDLASNTQWQRVAVNKVTPTVNLLPSHLRARLSGLYAKQLCYIPPGGVGPANVLYAYQTYDDTKHASRTISSITIRCSYFIEVLAITYSDGLTTTKHGGGGHVGVEYEFALATGEHIIEMLIWVEGDWLFGLQFVTNLGRCSDQYGIQFGPPIVARCKGGILVGFLSHTKLHPEYKEMYHKVQGIWRCDLLPRIPKEDDVYSEYFGDKNRNGRAFNDRVLVGNSTSIHISSVEVWSGEFIDRIQFTYTEIVDGREFKSTAQHGGPGGSYHRFALENGEQIVTVSGKHEAACITQLCFVTNRGRTSEVFGGGKGQSLSALAPRDKDGNCFRLQYICGKSNDVSLTGIITHLVQADRADNNRNPHPPEPDQDSDILASTSLKNIDDKDALLQNIGCLFGIRVDSNDCPQILARQVAKFARDRKPVVREINELSTESITTKTERETNYIHHGWSIAAASTTNSWISSRIASNNQPNAEGTWSEIEAALKKPTIFQRFEAVYQALHDWGDVVALGVEMGTSLVLTDLETNMSKLPDTATWTDTRYLATIRTARTRQVSILTSNTKELIFYLRSIPQEEMSSYRNEPSLDWRQTRITRVVDTLQLLPAELQGQLSQLYTQRLSYIPAITIGPSDSSCATHDDTPLSEKTISGVSIYASDYIRSMRFAYTDKLSWSKHKGSEEYGSEHEFILGVGEHITEMLIWKGSWGYVNGLQLITSFGRCSPHFGGTWGTPTVARSKGGALVGIISLIRKHDYGRMFRDIQGIWRHDIIDTVPKEEDVFSDYFGFEKGKPFNDRIVVRNSDITISKIEVWSGSEIDCLRFTYCDREVQGLNEIQTERHGGRGNRKEFVLEPGEHIVNKNRSTEIYGKGQSNGESHSFAVSSPKDKEGKRMRLHYVCGKSDSYLNGIMFVWTHM
ncbi:unnamed protein product [Rhizoctonia solani]|uniref:Jacalin-type lectin domain-containing protein n=1 Tax=Rhizoctonia solani TaxID=456999 RepID=A0A8H3E8E2_9AGAM|nr:unnamed protein product [Rhizoctonia solani]